MFDYSLMHWSGFLTAAVLLNIAPGPDNTFILARTASGGKRAGFAAMLGSWCGASVHVLMAAVGLSAMLAASASAFSVVKWLGAAYLIWLGIHALRSDGKWQTHAGPIRAQSAKRIFRQGVLVAALNPKVAVFFLAFLPQFVVPGAGPVAAQFLLHGSLIIVVAGLVDPVLILASDRLLRSLRDNPRFGRWLDRALGGLLISLGLKLASSKL